jgi:hypothetical protein
MVSHVTPIRPYTDVDPGGVQPPNSSVEESPGKVTGHQVTCDYTLWCMVVLLSVMLGAYAVRTHTYRERNYAFGQAMLTLRTAMNLTQAGLAQVLGVSRHAVQGWEAGSS